MSFQRDQADGLRALSLSVSYDVELICASDSLVSALCLSKRIQDIQRLGQYPYVLDFNGPEVNFALKDILEGKTTIEKFLAKSSEDFDYVPSFLICTDYKSIEEISALCVEHAKVTLCIDNDEFCIMQAYALVKALQYRGLQTVTSVYVKKQFKPVAEKFVGTVKQFLNLDVSLNFL